MPNSIRINSPRGQDKTMEQTNSLGILWAYDPDPNRIRPHVSPTSMTPQQAKSMHASLRARVRVSRVRAKHAGGRAGVRGRRAGVCACVCLCVLNIRSSEGRELTPFFSTIRQAGGFVIFVDVDGHFRMLWPAQRHLCHMATG